MMIDASSPSDRNPATSRSASASSVLACAGWEWHLDDQGLTLTVLLLLGTLTTLPAQSSSRFVLASVVDPQTDTPLGGLAAEDFIIQEGSTPCETIAAKPAGYPIAILVDTSNVARPGVHAQMRGRRCGSWSAG